MMIELDIKSSIIELSWTFMEGLLEWILRVRGLSVHYQGK